MGNLHEGPTYSVPMQIAAQSEIDDVFWYNLCKTEKEDWKSKSYYHDLDDYPDESIKKLPAPFNKPDIIIIEQLYNIIGSPIRKDLKTLNIPYVIIPRSEFTVKAQKRKWLKKRIANFLLCNKYLFSKI